MTTKTNPSVSTTQTLQSKLLASGIGGMILLSMGIHFTELLKLDFSLRIAVDFFIQVVWALCWWVIVRNLVSTRN